MPLEVSTSKPKNDVRDQQVEEKPFQSDLINIAEIKNGTFANVSDCLYFYQRGGSVTLTSLNKNRTESVQNWIFDHKPIKFNGYCNKNLTHHETFISLRFSLNEGPKDIFKINATFTKSKSGFWQMTIMWAKFKTINKAFEFDCKHLETPIEFSYSCKNFTIEAKSKDEQHKIELNLKNLQIQPFYTKKVFAESFDCSTLFTLGSWMGLIVVWVFTVVVAIGIYALTNIKTMDKFDNAKGKSIMNIASTE